MHDLDQRIRNLEIGQAVAAERERCAKIAEDYWCDNDVSAQAGEGIAARIRSGE